jgi:hypothetical protein
LSRTLDTGETRRPFVSEFARYSRSAAVIPRLRRKPAALGPPSSCGLVPDDYKPTCRSLIDRMSELAENVARRHDGLLVDFGTHPTGVDPSIYSSDRIHLNARGHAICAVETLHAVEPRAAGLHLKLA